MITLSSCSSTSEPITANVDSFKVDQLLASDNTKVNTRIPAIAVRYPASIRLVNSESDDEVYNRLVQITDTNLKKRPFFVNKDDIQDETDLGSFFIRSTLLKARLAAHTMQVNIKSKNPQQLIFTQPMDMIVHPIDSGKGDCHITDGGEEETGFCLEVKPIGSEIPTPVNIVMDVAVFNDYNLSTYGINSYRSLGHEISPMVSIGKLESYKDTYDNPQFTYFDGVKGGLPDEISGSAFSCMFKNCKKKPVSSDKAFRQKPISFAEDTLFVNLEDLSDLALATAQKNNRSYESILDHSSIAIQNSTNKIPAFIDEITTRERVGFLQMENQFLDERSIQTATLFQDNLYQKSLSSFNAEEIFAKKLRKANKSKRTKSAIGFLGAVASATGALAAASTGDALQSQQFLSNMTYWTNEMELAGLHSQDVTISASDEARLIESQIGSINLDAQGFEGAASRDAGSISEVRKIQLELIK